jgi:RND family efflux transporter MFP subunit
LITAGTLFILALGFLEQGFLEQPPKETLIDNNTTIFHPTVSYINVQSAELQSKITTFGELKPRWDVVLKAQVSGAVKHIIPEFEVGSLIQKNTTLLKIEDSRYLSQKSEAQLTLAQAKLQLLQAQKKTQLAERDWLRSGMKPEPSDLALFKPQLKIAEQALEFSRQQLAVSETNLSYTRVKTAYTGIIAERLVGLGQQVQEGEPLLRLVDHQNLLLKLSLSEDQWQMLSNNWLNSQTNVYSTTKQLIGTATIIRGGHLVDSETRQYQLFLQLGPAQNKSALPGHFVQVNLPGKSLETHIDLPESALTREGIVWLIDQNDTLRAYTPDSIHYLDNRVMVPAPIPSLSDKQNNWRVATQPLAFFLAGKKVHAAHTSKETQEK